MITQIKENIWKRHIGIILKIDIRDSNDMIILDNEYTFEQCCNSIEIAEFYYTMGNNYLDVNMVNNYIQKDVKFFCVKHSGKIIACNVIFAGEISFRSLSFWTLKEKRNMKVLFDDMSIYSGFVVVDPLYRGRHLYKKLIEYILMYYSKSNVKNLVLITGATNATMLHASMKLKGRVIGIVEIRRILRYIINRKEWYMDYNEVCWSNIIS